MAQVIEHGKFKLIKCTAEEVTEAFGSCPCLCDWCGKPCLPSETGVYIAVLNQWYCEECFQKWIKRTKWYAEDAPYENRNFAYAMQRLKISK